MIAKATLETLADALRDHSHEWRNDNRDRLRFARQDLIEFTAWVINEAGSVDSRIVDANPDPQKCLANTLVSKGIGTITLRVSPMKTAAATYFVQVCPIRSYSGGGALLPPPRLARLLRQTIATHTGKWRGIVEGPVFSRYFPNGLTGGHDLGSKGYIKNHDALEFFNIKSFRACRNLADEMLTSPDLVQEVARSFAAARPLVDHINRATTSIAPLKS